jgi:hypothetical protein
VGLIARRAAIIGAGAGCGRRVARTGMITGPVGGSAPNRSLFLHAGRRRHFPQMTSGPVFPQPVARDPFQMSASASSPLQAGIQPL